MVAKIALLILWANALLSSATEMPLAPKGFLQSLTDTTLVDHAKRSLQPTRSLPQCLALRVLPPQRFYDFDRCVQDKQSTADMGVVGQNLAIRATCWCQLNMTGFLTSIGCCNYPDYANSCSILCNNDCTSAEVQGCLQQCPALCLMPDYAPDSCNCSSACNKHLICMTAAAAQATQNGTLSKVCNNNALNNSPENSKYNECVNDQTSGTGDPWQSYNARNYCVCKANVTAALSRNNCCGANWAQPICTTTCLSSADCATADAQTCLQLCHSLCKTTQRNGQPLPECAAKCLDPTQKCYHYRSCNSAPVVNYTYICDDGVTKPDSRGCCFKIVAGGTTLPTCPTVCAQQSIWQTTTGTFQCNCFSCPTSVAAITQQVAQVLNASSILISGQNILLDVAQRVGLSTGPSPNMQALANQRTKEVQAAIQKYGATLSPDLQAAMAGIDAKYQDLIQKQALTDQACANNPKSTLCTSPPAGVIGASGVPAPPSSTAPPAAATASVDTSIGLIIAIAISAVILVAGGIGGYCWFKGKSRADTVTMETNPNVGGMSPIEGDPNVVMGRPVVDPSAAASSLPAIGMPVNGNAKGPAQPSATAPTVATRPQSPPTTVKAY